MVPERSAAVVVRGGEVLVVAHTKGPERRFSHWCYPGGHVEPGEPPQATAIREVKEELGLDIRILRLLYELDHVLDDGPWHEYFFLAAPARGIPGDPRWDPGDPVVGGARWAPVGDLVALRVLPLTVTEQLVRDFREGWPREPRRLGAPGARVP